MPNEAAKKNEVKTVEIGPISIPLKTCLLGVASGVLIVAEYTKLTLLDMPIWAALVSFDALIATIANAGLIVLLGVVTSLILMLIVWIVLLGLFYAYILGLRTVIAVHFAKFGMFPMLRRLLSFRTTIQLLWFRAWRNNQKVSASRRVLEAIAPSLRDKRETAQKSHERLVRRERLILHLWRRKSQKSIAGLTQIFITFRDTSTRARRYRWIVAGIVLVVVLVLNWALLQYRVSEMDPKSRKITGCGEIRLVKQPSKWLPCFLDNPFGRFVSAPFEKGTVVFARGDIAAASHLHPFHASEGVRLTNGMRREWVYYLGDYGDWAYLARAAEPDQRLMVRKSNVVEFARAPFSPYTHLEPDDDEAAPLVDLSSRKGIDLSGLRLAIWDRRWSVQQQKVAGAGGGDNPDTDLAPLRQRIDALSDRVGTLHAQHETTAGRLRHHETEWRAQNTETRAWRRLTDKLIAAMETDLAAVKTQVDALDTRLTALPRRMNTGREATDAAIYAQLSDLAAWRVAASKRLDALIKQQAKSDASLAATAARVIGLDARQTSAQGQIGGLQMAMRTIIESQDAEIAAVNARIDDLPNAGGLSLRSETDIAELFGKTLPSQISRAIQEGFSTRPTGTFDDLQRRFTAQYYDRCTSNRDPNWTVAFGEGERWSRDTGLLLEIAAELRKKSAATSQFILLRGGASFTGNPEANIRLSEARAEWVKTRLLRNLLGAGNSADLADRARGEMSIQIAAIGLGERLGNPHSGRSPRDVEVFLCDPPRERLAENQ